MRRQNVVAIEKAKQELLDALSVEEVVELVYNKCPSYGELTSFISMLRGGSSLDDIRVAKQRSVIFRNIKDVNDIGGNTLTTDFEHLFKLATHEQSEDGADISTNEYEILNEFLSIMGFLVSDHATMLDSKYKTSKNKKERREISIS